MGTDAEARVAVDDEVWYCTSDRPSRLVLNDLKSRSTAILPSTEHVAPVVASS